MVGGQKYRNVWDEARGKVFVEAHVIVAFIEGIMCVCAVSVINK